MRVYVVGYGSMGQRHAANAQALGHQVAVYDPDESKWDAALKEAYLVQPDHKSGYQQVLGPEAVVVACPASGHADAVEQFLKAADPEARLFVEKPLGLDADLTWWQRLAATSLSASTAVGYMLRFHPGVGFLQTMLPTHVGAVRWARFVVDVDGASWPGADYADALLECSHELDLARYLLGEAEVSGAAASPDGQTWEIVLRHDSGAVSTVHLSTAGRGAYERQFRVMGEAGEALWKWDAAAGTFRATARRHADRSDTAMYAGPCRAEDLYRDELAAWLAPRPARTLLDPAGPVPRLAVLADGLAALRLVQRARAASSGTERDRADVPSGVSS